MPVVRAPVLNAVSVWALTAPVAPKAKAATIESVTRMRIVLFSRCEALPSPRCRTVGPAPNIGCSVSDGRHAADTQGPMRFNLRHAQKAEADRGGNSRHDREGREDPARLRRFRARVHAPGNARLSGELGCSGNTECRHLGDELRAGV